MYMYIYVRAFIFKWPGFNPESSFRISRCQRHVTGVEDKFEPKILNTPKTSLLSGSNTATAAVVDSISLPPHQYVRAPV